MSSKIKLRFIAAAIALGAAVGFATEANATPSDELIQLCAETGSLAQKIMLDRQNNDDMEGLLGVYRQVSANHPNPTELQRAHLDLTFLYIKRAHSMPRYWSDDMRQ